MAVTRNGVGITSLGTKSRPPIHSVPSLLIEPHQEYKDRYPEWITARDLNEGEWRVKSRAQIYLPKIQAQLEDEYKTYLENATFYNGVGITVQSLMGSLFLHEPSIALYRSNNLAEPLNSDDYPENFTRSIDLERITKDGNSLNEFLRQISTETILTSRAGVLVDLPRIPSVIPKPYITLYKAEQIINWRYRTLESGERILDQVCLVEVKEMPSQYGMTEVQVFRVLGLDPAGDYYQEVITSSADPASVGKIEGATKEIIYPEIRGERLKFIPFQFFGARINTAQVNKMILTDIITMNLSHYKSYAQLEHGRFYAGMPTYYVKGNGMMKTDAGSPEGGTFIVGPNNLWVLGQDDEAGILEFNGSGLQYLENAIEQKQAQMATLGSKLQVQGRRMAAQSSANAELSALGERATLNDVASNIDAGMNKVFEWLLTFASLEDDFVLWLTMNKDFEPSEITAREMRAIESLFEKGLLSVQLIYETFRDAGIVKSEVSLQEFEVMIKKRMEEKKLEADEEFKKQQELKKNSPAPIPGGKTSTSKK